MYMGRMDRRKWVTKDTLVLEMPAKNQGTLDRGLTQLLSGLGNKQRL